jgi:hypothetical protein
MTPKEKADELHVGYWYLTNDSRIAKQCALMAVNEILNNNNKIPGNVSGLHTIENTYYWQEVKQEIEKL